MGALFLTLGFLFTAISAFAQSPAVKLMGWSKSANLGLNLSFNSSQSVVGQADGSSQTYGLNFKGEWTRTRESDEWRNTLSAIGSTTRTPNLPHYIKTSDEVKVESIYLYSLPNHPTIGPYVRGEAAAPMFKGEDVEPDVRTFRIAFQDQTVRTVNVSSLRLTDPFRPLTTKEALGFFWKAVRQEKLKLELRIGLSALQIDADGQLAVQGTSTAGEIQVTELRDVRQAGLELAIAAKGNVDEKSSYEIGASTMTPFINNKSPDDDRDPLELTNVGGFTKLSSNISKWAAFGYNYTVKLQPQLQTRAEQIHMLTLNVNYILF